MSRNKPRRSGSAPSQVTYAAAPAQRPPAFTPAQYALGLVFLAVAVAMTVILVLGHFDAMAMPGCGEGSACDQAAASKWGKIPGIGERGWPVSFLGLAYFVGLFVAWMGARGGVPSIFLWIVRLGVLGSLFFIGVLFKEGHICQYCLGTHAANIAFWLLLESSRRQPAARIAPAASLAGVFLGASVALYAMEHFHNQAFIARQDADRRESEERILAEQRKKEEQLAQAAAAGDNRTASSAGSASNATGGAAPAESTGGETAGAAADAGSAAAGDTTVADVVVGGIKARVGKQPWTGGFTGRWRLGPEKAKVRIVMLTDYQCPDCKRIEGEVMAFVKETPDVSLSIKHFPMDKSCNDYMTATLHGNACWAARAAEAAGLLYGNDGFWKMHEWLFEHGGAFTNTELEAALVELGFDTNQFLQTMVGNQTEFQVKSDIEEGNWLGLHYTPMVFINGVELVGVFPRNAVADSAKRVLATNPTPMNADLDQPQPAVAKYINDWKVQPPRKMPTDFNMFHLGSDAARTKVVVWIDYQQDVSPELNTTIREWMKDKPDVMYNVRHYPFNQECNASAPRTAFPKSCLAARAAEAAGMLGGRDSFWQMHEWLLANQSLLSEDTLRAAATGMGLDPDQLFAKMNSPEVANAITQDAQVGKAMLYRGTPTVYVNDKVLPRWKKVGDPVLTMILNEAYKR